MRQPNYPLTYRCPGPVGEQRYRWYRDFSWYRDRNGASWKVGTGGVILRSLCEFTDSMLDEIFEASDHDIDAAREVVGVRLVYPGEVDNLSVCDDCGIFRRCDHETASASWICDSCAQGGDYATCVICELMTDDYYGTNDGMTCRGCYDNSYVWCDHCDESFHIDSDHSHVCDCEPGTTRVTLPNGLSENTHIGVALPDGIISDAGMIRVRDVVWAKLVEVAPEDERANAYTRAIWACKEAGNEWKTARGTFPKRLSSALYKIAKIKLDDKTLSEIGNIARDASKGAKVTIEFTRHLNGDPGDYYHEGSCWWTEYASSRCALKNNGGMAMLSYDETPSGYSYVMGRAWVMPAKLVEGHLQPTFDAANAEAFVMFNNYGALEERLGPRILAELLGKSQRGINMNCSEMYLNGDAHLIADEAFLETLPEDYTLHWDHLGDHSNLYYTERKQANA